MRITRIELKNFKRFTNLVIKDIPASAKLVILVGPNGSGKSSLFDALLHWYRLKVKLGINGDALYYRKSLLEKFEWAEVVSVTTEGNKDPLKGSLYVRSAYRNDPDFEVTSFERAENPIDRVSLERLIDTDQTVGNNYKRLVHETTAALYDPANDAKTVASLRAELIGGIKSSMARVFGDLTLSNISDPLGEGTFFFEKSGGAKYHYKNLSGGEKSAFDLILDMHIKKKYYTDAVYCIDEIETHLHTRIQGKLLHELYGTAPVNSQLWVTTHSLGVLRAAQEIGVKEPGSVCVIDFDVTDPDVPREIVPSALGRVVWEKLLSIALDDLSTRIAPKTLVVCEGSSVGTRRKDFDAEIYNRILGGELMEVSFVSGGSSNQVAQSGVSVQKALADIIPTAKVVALCDRDDKSAAEVSKFEAGGNIVLVERNLECYLFADDVIEALVVREGKAQLLNDALQLKQDALAASEKRGNAPDDLKSAAGDIYVGLKKLLALQRCGNSTDAFMRDTLAPLVTPGTATYNALKVAVVDRLPR